MKRALVFLLLGPTVGFILAIGSAVALGVKPWDAAVLGVIVAYSYAAGIIPATLTGLFDQYIATTTTGARRILQTAGAGYVISAFIGLTLLSGRLSVGAVLIFAIYGAIAAAACSFLCGSAKATRSRKNTL